MTIQTIITIHTHHDETMTYIIQDIHQRMYHKNDCELTSIAEVRASSGSGDVVGVATKRNSPNGLVFDLV
jgi:hypothetical protein